MAAVWGEGATLFSSQPCTCLLPQGLFPGHTGIWKALWAGSTIPTWGSSSIVCPISFCPQGIYIDSYHPSWEQWAYQFPFGIFLRLTGRWNLPNRGLQFDPQGTIGHMCIYCNRDKTSMCNMYICYCRDKNSHSHEKKYLIYSVRNNFLTGALHN